MNASNSFSVKKVIIIKKFSKNIQYLRLAGHEYSKLCGMNLGYKNR